MIVGDVIAALPFQPSSAKDSDGSEREERLLRRRGGECLIYITLNVEKA